MKVLAIDPGTTESAFVLYVDGKIQDFAKVDNYLLLTSLNMFIECDYYLIEMIEGRNMKVSSTTFDTILWTGQFKDRIKTDHKKDSVLIFRRKVKSHFRKYAKINECDFSDLSTEDAIIRRMLIHRFGSPGTKKNPGLTYGLKADIWQAFALAVYFVDTLEE